MKRLLPFDLFGPGHQPARRHPQTGALRRLRDEDIIFESEPVRPEPLPQPASPALDPRRTALYAVVCSSDPGTLYVREQSIEISSFQNSGLMQVSRTPGEPTDQQVQVTINGNTSFDMTDRASSTVPGTPVIVIGLEIDGVVEAEIIAGMDAEPRYRTAVARYQHTRDWLRQMSIQPRSDSA